MAAVLPIQLASRLGGSSTCRSARTAAPFLGLSQKKREPSEKETKRAKNFTPEQNVRVPFRKCIDGMIVRDETRRDGTEDNRGSDEASRRKLSATANRPKTRVRVTFLQFWGRGLVGLVLDQHRGKTRARVF